MFSYLYFVQPERNLVCKSKYPDLLTARAVQCAVAAAKALGKWQFKGSTAKTKDMAIYDERRAIVAAAAGVQL